MSKVELTVYVEEELVDVLDSVKDASRERTDMWDMSRSEAAREFLERGVDELGEEPALEELVDDLDLTLWRKQQKQERLQKRGRIHEMTGGWRGRVRTRFNRRLAGPEPYEPEKMAELTELYYAEIETWEEDESKLPEHRDWLDDLMATYRDAYEAKQVVPDDAFEHVDDVQTGADLLRLRDRFDEVLLDVGRVAEAESYDVDAIYRRLAGDYAVEEETIEMVVDELTGEETDTRRALKSGEGILDAVDRERLDAWGGDVEALSEHEPGTDADDVDVVDVLDEETVEEAVDPEDVAREVVIEEAEELLEEGASDDEIAFQLGRIADTEAELNAALQAARRRRGAGEEGDADE